MTNAETSTLVFKDQAGEYYLLPQETLERGRVPAEHTAEVERLISEQHDDVQGHLLALALPLVFVLACKLPEIHEAGPTPYEVIKAAEDKYRRTHPR